MGLPTRFKYRKVEENDFGLDVTEVLSAPDRELNAWCSLKKTCSYRTPEEEKHDVFTFRNKGKNPHLKKKILPSLFVDPLEDESENPLVKEQNKKAEKVAKKKNKKRKIEETLQNNPE